MIRRCNFYMLGILMLSFCFTLSPLAQEKKEIEEVYTIKQGDTLWDISSKFFKDPFLWPKLWQRNSYITNPHWIYPGKPIRLSDFEESKKEEPNKVAVEEKPKEGKTIDEKIVEAMPKGKEAETEVKKEGSSFLEKKPEAATETKNSGKKPEALDIKFAGFLSDVDLQGIGIILDNREGKIFMSQGDIAYLSFKTSSAVMIGDKYTVFRVSDFVKDPTTDQNIGRKYNIIGNIQIIDQQGNFFTAKVIESFDAIIKGDRLRPYMKEKMEVEGKK